MNQSYRQNRKGFTLIELLVVIAIIAILAAILFPVFAQAKASAKKASDLSNFKQTGLAIMMYATDVDDSFVATMYGPDGADGFGYNPAIDTVWQQVVQPYEKNWQITHNPADAYANDTTSLADMGVLATAPQRNREYAIGITCSEGYNYMAFSPMMTNPTTGGAVFIGSRGSAITEPAQCIMLADSAWDRSGTQFIGGGNWFIEAPTYWYSVTQWWFGGWQYSNATSWLQYGGVYPIHSGQKIANITFGDGHAKGLTVGAMLAGVSLTTGGVVTGVYDQNLYLWDRGT